MARDLLYAYVTYSKWAMCPSALSFKIILEPRMKMPEVKHFQYDTCEAAYILP